jgi:hypothetical protein
MAHDTLLWTDATNNGAIAGWQACGPPKKKDSTIVTDEYRFPSLADSLLLLLPLNNIYS